VAESSFFLKEKTRESEHVLNYPLHRLPHIIHSFHSTSGPPGRNRILHAGGRVGSARGGTDELNRRLPKLHGSTEKLGDVTDAPIFPILEEKLQCKQ